MKQSALADENVSTLSELSKEKKTELYSLRSALYVQLQKQTDYYIRLLEEGLIDRYGIPLDEVNDGEDGESDNGEEEDEYSASEDHDEREPSEGSDPGDEDYQDIEDDLDIDGQEEVRNSVWTRLIGQFLTTYDQDEEALQEFLEAKASTSSASRGSPDPDDNEHGSSAEREAVPTVPNDDPMPQRAMSPTAHPESPIADTDDAATSDDDEDEDEAVVNLNVGAFDNLIKLVFAEPHADLLDVLDAAAHIPQEDALHMGFRLGHAPIRGVCPFYDCPLAPLPPAGHRKGWFEKTTRHLKRCGEKHALENIDAAAIISSYPSTAKFPLTRPKEGPVTIRQIQARLVEHFRMSGQKSWAFKPYRKCTACKTPTILKSAGQVRDHLLLEHGAYVPHALKKGGFPAWDANHVPLPKPIFFAHLQRYVIEPRAQLKVASKMLADRIIGPAENIRQHGLRKDIDIPEDALPADRSETNELVADQRYMMVPSIPGRRSPACLDGLCLLCVNDERSGLLTRMRPFGDSFKQLQDHQKNCLMTLLDEVDSLNLLRLENKPIPIRHTPFWDKGRLLCLDPVCAAIDRQFDTKLEFVQHLAAVHYLALRGTGTKAVRPTLELLTFPSEKALEGWQSSRDGVVRASKNATEKGKIKGYTTTKSGKKRPSKQLAAAAARKKLKKVHDSADDDEMEGNSEHSDADASIENVDDSSDEEQKNQAGPSKRRRKSSDGSD